MKSFSVDGAQDVVNKIAPLVEEMMRKRRDLAIRLLASDPQISGRSINARSPRLAAARSPFPAPQFGDLKSEIVRLVHRIESFGCIVKDLDLGTVDFLTTLDGERVFLCWKAGEASIDHWHGVDEGFIGRKKLPDRG